MPVLGTCAGAILLASRVENHPVAVLGAMDVTAVRNAYGTQVDSFAAPVDDDAAPGLEDMRCVFIRAPQLTNPGPGVDVLARVESNESLRTFVVEAPINGLIVDRDIQAGQVTARLGS